MTQRIEMIVLIELKVSVDDNKHKKLQLPLELFF